MAAEFIGQRRQLVHLNVKQPNLPAALDEVACGLRADALSRACDKNRFVHLKFLVCQGQWTWKKIASWDDGALSFCGQIAF